MRWNIPSAGLVLFLFERSGRMGKVLIWFVIIISTVVLYCLMKVKAESDELCRKNQRIHTGRCKNMNNPFTVEETISCVCLRHMTGRI